jgi:hypothetical protein
MNLENNLAVPVMAGLVGLVAAMTRNKWAVSLP